MVIEETFLLREGAKVLQRVLPTGWAVDVVTDGGPGGADAVLALRDRNQTGINLLAEARRDLRPADVPRLLGGPLGRRIRQRNSTPIVVIANYLSPATRSALAEEGIGYIDLTGNIGITLDHPALVVRTDGARRNPHRDTRDTRGLRGAAAGSIIRALADAAPPYGVTDLARATGATPGYVSRVLDGLEQTGLIVRGRRGAVEVADWQALLRERGRLYNLVGQADLFVAPRGLEWLDELRGLAWDDDAWMVTGSAAAARLRLVAEPMLVVVYAMAPRVVATRGTLLPATTEGANVAIIRPPNRSVFDRAVVIDGVPWAAPSQVALDCLAGPGRMPAEGEAVLSWMTGNEGVWRAPSLSLLGRGILP